MPVFPPQKLKRGEIIFYMSGPLLSIKWCHKRQVLIIDGIGLKQGNKMRTATKKF